MAKKHFTAMGEQIDMSSLVMRHSNQVALGNASMNARGDIIGENQVVLRTQEQVEEEYRRAKERERNAPEVSRDIKSPLPSASIANLPSATKDLSSEQDFNPDPIDGAIDINDLPKPSVRQRRKIVDAD